MKRNLSVALFLGMLTLAGCAAPGFHYTGRFRDGTVLPILKKEVGENARYYNYEQPMIARNGDDIAIVLGWDFLKGGDVSPDPPYVTILVDPATGAVRNVATRASDQ